MVISDLPSETIALTAKHASLVESVLCQALTHRSIGDAGACGRSGISRSGLPLGLLNGSPSC